MATNYFIDFRETAALVSLAVPVNGFLLLLQGARKICRKLEVRLASFSNSFRSCKNKNAVFEDGTSESCTGVPSQKEWNIGIRHIGRIQQIIAMKECG